MKTWLGSKRWAIAMLALSLAACTAGRRGDGAYTVDTAIRSPNQDSRVHALILHYTAEPLVSSLHVLTDPAKAVSAHYLVPDTADAGGRFRIFRLVPESSNAWHAGTSSWQGARMLNSGSIGIEITNLGYPPEDDAKPLEKRRWYPYPDEQLAVVARLAADIVARHRIPPYRVLGHADIAPGRKFDPGPLFPWKRLYEQYGVGAWPDAMSVERYRREQPYRGDVAKLQAKLLAYGYDTPQTGVLDRKTTDVIAAFQMHFRPARYDGVPDVETVAILDALNEKYLHAARLRLSRKEAS